MKKLIPTLLLFIVLSACDNETLPLIDHQVLAEIQYQQGDQSWQETYEYNDAGQVVSISTSQSWQENSLFSYSGNLLTEIRRVNASDGQLIFRDSLVYNNAGQLEKIYNFSINVSADVGLSHIETFTYNNVGQVIESSKEFLGISGYAPRNVYHWEDGNIIQADQYNGDELMHEFFFIYDNKPALQIETFVVLGEPNLTTENNIISTDWIDYTGVLDTTCKPCTSNYTYFPNDLPRSLQTNWGLSATFIYKEFLPAID